MGKPASGKIGLIWSAVNTWTNNLLSLLIVGILARILTPDDFGLIGLAGIFIALGAIFLSDTVSVAIIQLRGLQDEHLDSAFWGIVGLGVIIYAIEVALAPIFAAFFSEPRLTLVLQVVCIRLLFDALMAVPLSILLKSLDFRALAIRSAIANAIGGTTGVAIALAGGGVWALVAQQLVNGLVTFIICLMHVAWRPKFVFSPRHARDLIPSSGHMMLQRWSAFGASNFDRILVGNFLGTTFVGFYTFARRIQIMSTDTLNGVVDLVAFPLFSNKQHDPVALTQSMFRAASYTSLITFPIFAGLAVAAPDIIPMVFGAQWGPAIPVIQILACNTMLATPGGIHESIMKAVGRADRLAALSVGWAVLMIIGYLISARHGLVAIAFGILIVNLIIAPIDVWIVRSLVPFSVGAYVKIYLGPLIAAAGMALIILLLRNTDLFGTLGLFAKVALEVAIGAVVYASLVLVFARSQTVQLVRYLSRPSEAA